MLAPLLACTPGVTGTLEPGFRNEFHAGLQQAFGKNIVISGDYIWKYTRNAFDFSILGSTPIFFPTDWHNSKIPGFVLRADVPNFHNVSAFVVMSCVSARFFPPQVAGAGATVGAPGLPFRIDHDERFNETTHVQYQIPGKRRIWGGINWRYDSGLVAGALPCYNPTGVNTRCGATSITLPDGTPGVDLSVLTPDQQFQAGISCVGVKATPTAGFYEYPPRVAPRDLFDASVGVDNMFRSESHRWSLRLTAVNVTNKYALYNFLSTFSGTHYVTPRAMTAELGFHF